MSIQNEQISEKLVQQKFYIRGNYQELLNYTYDGEKIHLEEEGWKLFLNEWQYYIIRNKGTERAFTGSYYKNHQEGIYTCLACGLPLFESKAKYDSGSGWPSFYQPIKKENEPLRIREEIDLSYGMIRTEIMCNRCGGHLGHVFPDGPRPTGLRYCVNSASIRFVAK
jgi:methionine-R-sulfoxide reductase